MQSKVIVNADDFGLTESCSKAIAEAFNKNLISSTTACANGDYIEKAVELAKNDGFTDRIGVHLNVTEGTPLTESIKSDSFFCENGKFHGKIERYKKPTEKQLDDFKEEITAQINRLIGLGINPTHIDSHHHIHTAPYLINAVKETAEKFGINKIRLHRNLGKINPIKRVGKSIFNKKLKKSGFITTQKFGGLDDAFTDAKKVSEYFCEIMVHPDYDAEGILIDRREITDQGNFGVPLDEIKKIIDGVKIVGYGDL